jgi:hypothetical protein
MTTAHAQMPEFFNFDDNYYTTYGGPDITASIVGDNEFSRGDTVTIDINMMNKGVITGFESDEEVRCGESLDMELQMQEMQYESQKTTAIGIVASVASKNPEITVKSGPQEAGSLRSGEELEVPVQFTLEISNNAASGEHPLVLILIYAYQENVQISGDEKTDEGIRNMEMGLWYETKVQEITIPINVEKKADFEIVNVTADLTSGEEGLVHVTYKNVGEMSATDSTARITVSDPFSTTDDQAYLGTLNADETAIATFKLKVDKTATHKVYGITSKIKYEDENGHDQISDSLKITIDVLPDNSRFNQNIGMIFVLVGMTLAVGLGFLGYRKFSIKTGGKN